MAHVSRALGALDRLVDPLRATIPISATQIRASLFEHRQFLSPRVYRDLVTHVVFLGAPCTGKTTIAQAMAERLGTVWVSEYGREYWERHQVDRRLTMDQLVEIAIGHREREDERLMQANRYLFIDTDATTTLQFSKYYHESARAELVHLADQTRDRYDVFFLCEPDIPYHDTWDRSGEVSRDQMQRRIEPDLLARRIPFHRLAGAWPSAVNWSNVCSSDS